MRWTAAVATLLAVLLTGQFALSQEPVEPIHKLYPKGNAESTLLGPAPTILHDVGVSTFVISAQSRYDMGCATGSNEICMGYEAVRVWGRTDNVQSVLPSNQVVWGVNRAEVRFMCHTERGHYAFEPACKTMTIVDQWPPEDEVNLSWLTPLYDLVSLKSIPTGTADTFAKSLAPSIKTWKDGRWDRTVVFDAGLLSAFAPRRTDLPAEAPYTEATFNTNEIEGTLAAYFTFSTPKEHTNFKVWPQGRVRYLVTDAFLPTGGTFYLYSGPAGVLHTINTR